MKKLLSISLVLVMLASMTACGNPNTGEKDPGANDPAKESSAEPAASEEAGNSDPQIGGDINMMIWGNGEEVAGIKEKANLFNQNNGKEIKMSVEALPNADYNTKLNATLTAGTAPDVIMESADFNGFYYRNGNFENLTPFVERDGINLEELFIAGIDKGNVYDGNYREALPFTGSGMVMAYNKDLFDKAGITYPTDDWTWDDLLVMTEKLTTGEGQTKQYGISDHWAVKTLAPFAAGGEMYDITVDPPVMKANDPKTIAGIDQYVQLMRTGMMPDIAAAKGMPSEQRFFAGMSGMIMFFSWDASNFSKSIGEAFKWDTVQMPKNTDGSRISLSWTTGFAMNTASDSKDAAWEFIKHACLSEESNKSYAKVGMPVLKSVAEEYGAQVIDGTDVSYNVFVDAMEYGRINPFGGSFYEIADEFTRYWEKLIIEGADVKQSMEELQKSGQPILEKLMVVSK